MTALAPKFDKFYDFDKFVKFDSLQTGVADEGRCSRGQNR
jgi:hypothetical protein